jgi:hypothetical protein
VVEACPHDPPGRFRIRDNDEIHGAHLRNPVDGLGLKRVRTAFRFPWQNWCAARWIGKLLRECLDHVIAINEQQLLHVARSYVDDFHHDRAHLGPGKDAAVRPEIETGSRNIVALPRVCGLHHRYAREEQKAV